MPLKAKAILQSLIVLTLMFSVVMPANPVDASGKLISDPVLEQAVLNELRLPASHRLTEDDLLKLESLFPLGQGKIKSLHGLEHALFLKELYIPDHEIDNACPLAGLGYLERLELSGNRLGSIDCLHRLYSLKDFAVDRNTVSELAALAHLPISWLSVNQNRIADLSPLARHRTLTYLEAKSNRIRDVEPLASAISLQAVSLQDNPLSGDAVKLLEELARQGIVVNDSRMGPEQVSTIPVYVDDRRVYFDVNPIRTNGSLLVQFRPLFERLGLSVGWDGNTGTVTGEKEGIAIKLQIGSAEAWAGGRSITLAAAPELVNGSTFVPLRFVGEALGYEVVWLEQEQAVEIYTGLKTITSFDERAAFEISPKWKAPSNYYGDAAFHFNGSDIIVASDPKEYAGVDHLQAYYELFLKELKEFGYEVNEVIPPAKVKGIEMATIRFTDSVEGLSGGPFVWLATLLEAPGSFYQLITVSSPDRIKSVEPEHFKAAESFRLRPSPEERYQQAFGGMRAEDRFVDSVAFYKKQGYLNEYSEADLRKLYEVKYSRKEATNPFQPSDAMSRYSDLYVLELDRQRVWKGGYSRQLEQGKYGYADLLKEWAAISRGAFQPTDIREVWLGEQGPLKVEFMLAGKKRTLYPYVSGGAVDIWIVGHVNDMIRETGYQFEIADAYGDFYLVMMLRSAEKKLLEQERFVPFLRID